MEWVYFFYLLPVLGMVFLGGTILLAAIAWLRLTNKIASELRKNTTELKRGTDELERAANELRKDADALQGGNIKLKEEIQKLYTILQQMCWWIPRR